MPDETASRVAHLLKLFHPEAHNAGVKIDLLSVASDKDGPALKHQGYPAAAIIRVIGIKERTKGAGDVEILFDEEQYMEMSDAEKDALIDHELEHIEVKMDGKRAKLDCRGRPKIGMRKHDYQFGWFSSIAERHGIASGEVQQANALFLREKQTFFAFINQPAALEASA